MIAAPQPGSAAVFAGPALAVRMKAAWQRPARTVTDLSPI